MGKRIEYFDTIKGIAIVLVVFCHYVVLSNDSFGGNIMMSLAWAAVPPTYSAVKVNGDRAYALRRQGDSVELKPKTVRIDEIEVLDFNPEDMTMAIRVVCGKGTYIRAIARDLGRALKSGAYLTSLRRTRVGEVKVEECVDFDHFSEWLDKQIETE